MATRILFDPRVDLPDGTTGSSPVIVEATPTGIRADGSVFVLPTTLSFTISTPADQLLLAAPAASWGWNLAVRRAGAMLYGASQAGSVLARRTVTWTDAASVTWADLTDLDPATLEPTPDVSASWAATQELAQSALDAVNALKAGAPGALDTFLELATQLQADETGAAALAALVGTKAPLASPALTGTPTIGGTPIAKTTDISSAVAAITLAALGGVTPAGVDTKIAAEHGIDVGDFDVTGAAAAVQALLTAYEASVAATYQPLLPTTAIKTAAYTTAGNEIVPVDATASGVTVTLPNAPADKTRVSVKKIDASSNAVTIATAGSDAFNKAGGSVSATLTLLNQASTVQYVHATGVWLVVASDVPLSQLDSRYASKPAAAEQTIYVTPRGNDSNDGLSLSSAKATVTAGLAALAASYSWNRGKVLLGYGTIPLGSAEIALTANTANDEFGARGLTIEGCGVGMTVLDASAQTAGVTALHLTSASKMFINLRDFELKGPAQTVAGSRGIFWESPGGNYNWQNVYVHDFETGVEFYDATLGTAVNVAIRRCATGLSTDYQTDIHTWIGCRIDYCTTGVHVGNPTTTHPSTGSQEENNLQFIGARISNNGTAVFVDDYGASGLDFDGCYFEGNTKQLTVGRSNRTDTVGPSIHFGGCYWDPYITNSDGSHDTSQQATAFDIYNPASITIDQGSKVSGPTKFAVFANLQNANAVVRIASGGIQAATAAIQQGGLNFNPNGSGLGDIDYGLPLKLDYSAGASVPAAGWRRHQMSNRTGKTFESWEGISSADGSILSQAVVRDVGGVLHIEGLTNGGVAATRVPVLPAATANYYGLIYVLIGGVGAADIPYMCVLNSLGVYVWQALTGGSGPAGQPGPGTYGTPRTADPVSLPATARAMTTANDVRYFRVHDTATITQLSAQLLTAFAGGTAVLAVYRNNGSTGLAARPSGTPVAQGTASTTTAGTVTASLGGSIAVADGDWFAIGVDNTTAAFAGGTGISIGGFSYSQTGALGATPTFTMPTPASLVASGQFWGVWGS